MSRQSVREVGEVRIDAEGVPVPVAVTRGVEAARWRDIAV
jgi:hypothetical protein